MKILHLAAHAGNIGDNASHIGLRTLLSSILKSPFSITALEIRRFYNNYSLPDKMFFNKEFAELANSHDLLLIGGGAFLDFWVEGSETGTTLNISKPILDQISTPIIIASVGCIPHKEVPEGNVEKLRRFLDQLLTKKNVFLALRNDGSTQVLKQLFGTKFAEVPEVLDHGFFYENDGSHYKPCEQPYILINTTDDQVKMLNRKTGLVDEKTFVEQMQLLVNRVLEETSYSIVFAPHIYSDFKAINVLLEKVHHSHFRSRIVTTPHVQGDYGCNQIFSAYKNSNLVIGMRFHANVCSMAMNVPSLGIAALDRVTYVYESLGLPESAVSIDSTLSDVLFTKLTNPKNYGTLRVDEKLLRERKQRSTDLYASVLKKFKLS